MRVGLSALCGVTGGPATYARELAAALARRDDVELSVFTDRPDQFDLSPSQLVEVSFRGGRDRLRWQYLALGKAVRRSRVEVFHDTKNAWPLFLPTPGVVTVHDLAYHSHPETFPRSSRMFLKRATAHACRKARVVVVPSAWTGAELARVHPFCADRIEVVHHGIRGPQDVTEEQAEDFRRRFELPERFVLHVGTVQARKNVDLLVRAARQVRKTSPELRVVVVGRRGWQSEAAFAEIERDDTAHWLGEVDDQDLACAYHAADSFCSPSADEGFGFTVADAIHRGLPTLVADRGSLPEVTGDAALHTELDEPSVARALDRLWKDEVLRERLRSAGPQRAASFTWDKAAEATLQSYRRALGRA
ncbi:MAG: glycosyltransferase family 1 protein [Planctomycetota bacterium]